MNTDLRRALNDCIARIEAGADVDASLVGWEEHASELRPLLEAALSVRELTIEPHSERAFQTGKSRMSAAVATERNRPRRSGAWFWPTQSLPRAAAAVGVALVLALVALIGLTTDVLRSGTSTTQAEVEGFLTAIHGNELVLTTDDGLVTMQLRDDTLVLDRFGEPLPTSELVPGGPLTILVGTEDGVQTALKIELVELVESGQNVEVEFSGAVRSITASGVVVDASFGSVFVKIVPDTEVQGTIVAGSMVEVEGTSDGDGRFTASEIKVVGPGGGEDNEDEGSNSSPGGGEGDEDEGSNSGPGGGEDDEDEGSNSGPGGGEDDEDERSNSGPGGGEGDEDEGSNSGPGGGEDDEDEGSNSGSGGGEDNEDEGSTSGSGGGEDDEDEGSNSGSGGGEDNEDEGSTSGSVDDEDDESNISPGSAGSGESNSDPGSADDDDESESSE